MTCGKSSCCEVVTLNFFAAAISSLAVILASAAKVSSPSAARSASERTSTSCGSELCGMRMPPCPPFIPGPRRTPRRGPRLRGSFIDIVGGTFLDSCGVPGGVRDPHTKRPTPLSGRSGGMRELYGIICPTSTGGGRLLLSALRLRPIGLKDGNPLVGERMLRHLLKDLQRHRGNVCTNER